MPIFSTHGVEIFYLDLPAEAEGHEPPVLLIHGFASSHIFNWSATGWTKTLIESGRRTIVFDNRGHGQSAKLYDPPAYSPEVMAGDAISLLDWLDIPQADVIGYSMGARIAARLAYTAPHRVRRLVLGGLGEHLVNGTGLPIGIAEAMEVESPEALIDPAQRMFRAFADATKSDRRALAACIRGSRLSMSEEEVRAIVVPTLICIGEKDVIAGRGEPLAEMMPQASFFEIPLRDHNRAVSEQAFKNRVLAFLDSP